MHAYISYLSRSVYMERILPSRPGKAGSRIAQPGYRLKRDLQIVPGEIVPDRNILM